MLAAHSARFLGREEEPRTGRGSREIIGKRKSSSAPGSGLVEELLPPGGRGGSAASGVRAPLRLETLLCRSEPRGRPRLEEGPPALGADLLATRDRGGASSNHTHDPLYNNLQPPHQARLGAARGRLSRGTKRTGARVTPHAQPRPISGVSFSEAVVHQVRLVPGMSA